ncbi:hypothetical protein ACXZ66_09760 [Corynebacterium sp. S7]
MSDDKFYYSPSSGEVSQGKHAAWEDRMGPYDTAEEAAAALSLANKRNAAADRAEEADDNWGEPASWEKDEK